MLYSDFFVCIHIINLSIKFQYLNSKRNMQTAYSVVVITLSKYAYFFRPSTFVQSHFQILATIPVILIQWLLLLKDNLWESVFLENLGDNQLN